MTFFLLISLLSACSSNNDKWSSTTTFITVVEKDHSDDSTEAWIIAKIDEGSGKFREHKIYVDEFVVWNLIEENREYFVSFTTEGEKSTLTQIAYPGDPNDLV